MHRTSTVSSSERSRNLTRLRIALYLASGVVIGIIASAVIVAFQSDSAVVKDTYRQWQQQAEFDRAISHIPDGISERCWMLLSETVSTKQFPESVPEECERFMPRKIR